MLSTTSAIILLLNINFVFGYNIEWSEAFAYFDGSSRSPNLIHFRSNDNSQNEHLLICWEETGLIFQEFAGVCSTADLNLASNEIQYGDKEIFQAWNASDPITMQIYDNGPTNSFLLAYTQGTNSRTGPGKVLLGTKQSDGSLTYGPAATFNFNLNDQSRLLELQSNSYFIMCYSAGQFNAFDTACRVGQYHFSNQILFGILDYPMITGVTTSDMDIIRINSNTFLSCFTAYVQRVGACRVGSVNFESSVNSPIIYGTELVFNDGGTSSIKIMHASSTVLIICYLNSNYGECKFGTIGQIGETGVYTVDFKDEIFSFGMRDLIESPSIFRIPPNIISENNPELLGVCYVDDTAGKCQFGEIDLDSLVIIFDESTTNDFDEKGVGTITTTYVSRSQDSTQINKLVVCYVEFSGSTPLFNKGLCKYGTVMDSNKHMQNKTNIVKYN
eukprot:490982_1